VPNKLELLPDTHRSGQVPLQFLDDSRKTSASLVQEFPTAPHRLSVPSRGGMFLRCSDIPLLLVVEIELEERPELRWVCQEQTEHCSDLAHCRCGWNEEEEEENREISGASRN